MQTINQIHATDLTNECIGKTATFFHYGYHSEVIKGFIRTRSGNIILVFTDNHHVVLCPDFLIDIE